MRTTTPPTRLQLLCCLSLRSPTSLPRPRPIRTRGSRRLRNGDGSSRNGMSSGPPPRRSPCLSAYLARRTRMEMPLRFLGRLLQQVRRLLRSPASSASVYRASPARPLRQAVLAVNRPCRPFQRSHPAWLLLRLRPTPRPPRPVWPGTSRTFSPAGKSTTKVGSTATTISKRWVRGEVSASTLADELGCAEPGWSRRLSGSRAPRRSRRYRVPRRRERLSRRTARKAEARRRRRRTWSSKTETDQAEPGQVAPHDLPRRRRSRQLPERSRRGNGAAWARRMGWAQEVELSSRHFANGISLMVHTSSKCCNRRGTPAFYSGINLSASRYCSVKSCLKRTTPPSTPANTGS